MKKDEILAKARSEKTDEMEKFVRDRSAVWMGLAMVAAAAFFVCMRDENAPIMDLAATVSFSTSVCCIYRFVRLKQMRYLVLGIILAGMAVFATIRFFQGH